MKDEELNEEYGKARSRVRVWCDEAHRHTVKCLDGDARDIALIYACERYFALQHQIEELAGRARNKRS